MKYRTSKRAERPWWRRLKRAWDRWVEDLTRNEYASLPSYDEVRARAVRGINREVAATPLINRKNH